MVRSVLKSPRVAGQQLSQQTAADAVADEFRRGGTSPSDHDVNEANSDYYFYKQVAHIIF